jgi:hypothetical protein
MSLTVKSWHLRDFLHRFEEGQLDLSPDYQRREAWTAKKKMVLIDSIARRVPINAITLYKTERSGLPVYEVIDGKQRLTTLVQYKEGKMFPLSESLTGESEEEEAEGEDLAKRILDKKWNELDPGTKATFLDYEVPIYVVEGSRASAVRAFRRMNADPYALNPQEIRNAVFKDSQFLVATHTLEKALRPLTSGSDPFLVEWGLMTHTQWDRMKDLQFLSEILCLKLAGPQEARRSLDDFYSDYFDPHGKRQKELNRAVEQSEKAIRGVRIIIGESLKPHLFHNENDLYCLIGAVFQLGVPSAPQLADNPVIEDLRETLSLFRSQVLLYQEAVKQADESQVEDFSEQVREYGATLLGGQVNSAKRRQTRIDQLAKIIRDRIQPIDEKKPTELQRRLVWARSGDKVCARCKEKVKWDDYDCGHVDPKAFGGRAVVSNLRVEHAKCNRSAKSK